MQVLTNTMNSDIDLMPKKQIKSKERVAAHGEVFTNEREVNAMLDLVKAETERLDSRFLEPACGDGNFLIEILRRKLAICENRVKAKQYTQLQYEHDAIVAVSSLYGIELLPDNAEACRARLMGYISEQYRNLYKDMCKDEFLTSAQYILGKNIIVGDALTYKRVDEPDKWIHISEWSFIGDGKVNRRDYEFSYLVGEDEGDDLFSDLPAETFKPVYFLKINRESYGE